MTGLSGSHAAKELKRGGWHVTGLSRSGGGEGIDRTVRANLSDADDTKAALADAGDMTHVFICT